MWSDNETLRDLVNFSHVADIAAERIAGAKGEPLSIGISGDWGAGKSSMMKLLRTSLEALRSASSNLMLGYTRATTMRAPLLWRQSLQRLSRRRSRRKKAWASRHASGLRVS
jgi:pantothenate kinase-related protein Tda10